MSEKDAEHEPEGELEPFIVLHTNRAGHPFLTRVMATDDEQARTLIYEAHEDNDVEAVIEDLGGPTTITIVDLEYEP